MTTQDKSGTTGPTYIAYHVSELRPGKKRWNRIGAFFAHDDGQGGSLILDALPIAFDGQIVLRTPKTDSASEGGLA